MKAFAHILRQASSPTAIALWIKYTETFYPVRDALGRLPLKLYDNASERKSSFVASKR